MSPCVGFWRVMYYMDITKNCGFLPSNHREQAIIATPPTFHFMNYLAYDLWRSQKMVGGNYYYSNILVKVLLLLPRCQENFPYLLIFCALLCVLRRRRFRCRLRRFRRPGRWAEVEWQPPFNGWMDDWEDNGWNYPLFMILMVLIISQWLEWYELSAF